MKKIAYLFVQYIQRYESVDVWKIRYKCHVLLRLFKVIKLIFFLLLLKIYN